MVILDKMILTRRFTEFVRELVKLNHEDLAWDVWLHKIYDMEFSEYLSKLDNGASTQDIPQDVDLGTTVRDSMGIINGFCPS